MKKTILLLTLCAATMPASFAQVSGPDTVYVNAPANFSSTVQGGSYAWMAGSNTIASQNPGAAVEMLSPNTYSRQSAVMKYDNGNYYAFITTSSTGEVIRHSYGANPNGTPVMGYLGNFAMLGAGITHCIDIVQDNGNWYGFVTNGSTIVRLSFGSSLGNTPTASSISTGNSVSSGVQVSLKKIGNQWIGFCGNDGIFGRIVRLDFGTSLTNTPAIFTLPHNNALHNPSFFALHEQGGNWYMLVTNQGDHTIARYDFGSSLMNNTPACTNIGNPLSYLIHPRGINIIQDCNGFYVLVLNKAGGFIKLYFQNDITNTNPTATLLGYLDILAASDLHLLSPYWYNDSLSLLISSSGKLYSIPMGNIAGNGKAGYAQTTFTKTFCTKGTYNISLVCDEAQAFNGRSYCKELVVIDTPVAAAVNEAALSTQLRAYPNPTTGMITVDAPGMSGGIIAVYNEMGVLVKQEMAKTGKSALDLTMQPKGLYHVALKSEEGQQAVVNIVLK